MTYTTFILLLACLASCVFFYWRLTTGSTLGMLEELTAREMEPRAHRLCMQAYEATRAGQTFERIRLDQQFLDDLYLYIEDYQAEVVEKLQEHKVPSITGYGYTKLQ